MYTLNVTAMLAGLITLALSCHSALASANGMDMSMDGSMALTMGTMRPYLHFTLGDNLWFLGWVPMSPGAMVGACIGLFLLALIERWIAACRAMMEVHWAKRYAAFICFVKRAGFTPCHDDFLIHNIGFTERK
jgi:copper transporter 1